MKLFWRFIRTDVKKSKRNFVLFGCTIFLGVIAIVISLLLTRTGKTAICRYTFIRLWQL